MTMASLFTDGSTDRAKDLQGFVNPFMCKNVERIWITMSWEYREPTVCATISFKSGDTKGEHKINSSSLEDLLPRIKAFLEGMKQ